MYSENKKCQTCIELDVDNAKGSASVGDISMTFSGETMNLEAKVDDNALCSAPTDETCETADAVCGSGNLTMNYTMPIKQEGVESMLDVVMIVPMIMKGCLEKEKATCKGISEMIVEGAKEDAEKDAPVPEMKMLACMLNSCDSDGKNCEKLSEVKAPDSGAGTHSFLFSFFLTLLTQLVYQCS